MDLVERFAFATMSCGWGSVVGVEDKATEGEGYNNHQLE
jgi:hypothetical protein